MLLNFVAKRRVVTMLLLEQEERDISAILLHMGSVALCTCLHILIAFNDICKRESMSHGDVNKVIPIHSEHHEQFPGILFLE